MMVRQGRYSLPAVQIFCLVEKNAGKVVTIGWSGMEDVLAR